MVNKINLFKRDTPEESLSEDFIQIIPNNSCFTIIYEYERELNRGSEFSSKPVDIDQEILYFFSGNGIIRIASEEETVKRGDRIVIPNNSNYVIINSGFVGLRFIQIGISCG